MIIAGHGVWWSRLEEKLESLGLSHNIPIFNVPYHLKLLSESCPAYIGLADVHQYHPSKTALQEADIVIMVGARLDNQMNFGNPPLFPDSLKLICVNGSHEELKMNRAVDYCLLSDPGAFFDVIFSIPSFDNQWINYNRELRAESVEKVSDLFTP